MDPAITILDICQRTTLNIIKTRSNSKVQAKLTVMQGICLQRDNRQANPILQLITRHSYQLCNWLQHRNVSLSMLLPFYDSFDSVSVSVSVVVIVVVGGD